MHWRQATLAQLYEIGFNDQEAHITDKIASRKEIQRRRKQRYTRINYKRKEA